MNPLEQRDLTQELREVRHTYRSRGSGGMTVVIHAAVLLFLRWADFYESEQETNAAFDQVDYTPSLPNHLRWAALEKLSKFDLEKLWRNELSSSFRAEINTPLGDLLRQFAYAIDFNPPKLAEPLFQLFCWVSSLPFETSEDRSDCGKALESLISQTASGKGSGVFITPQPIVALMVALANPQPGERVYDPCFGTGGLLVASARELMKNAHLRPPQDWLDLRDNSIFGIEINFEAYVVGVTRLILEGIDRPCLELGDTLERPLPQIFTEPTGEEIAPNRKNALTRPARSQARKGSLETLRSNEGFDCILAVPPWGGKQTSSQYAYHFPSPVGSTEGLFLEHVMYSLRPGGRAVIALPDGVLFRQGRESKLRERLLTDFCVEGVIALPAGALAPYTGLRVNLLLLHRKPPAPSLRFFQVEDFPVSRQELANFTQTELELLAGKIVNTFRSNETTNNLWNTSIESLAKRNWELVVKRSGDAVLLQRLEELQATDPNLEVRPLRDIAEVFFSIARHQYRDYITKDSRDPEVTANILRVSDIREFGIREPELFLTRLGEAKLEKRLNPKYWLCPGDVVLSTSGTIGKLAFFTDAVGFRKTLAADGLAVIRPKTTQTITPEFLFILLRSPIYQEWLRGQAYGASIQHLSVQRLRDLRVPVPAIAIQHRLWKETDGKITDALATLLQGVTGVDDDPILKWLEGSKAVSALASNRKESEDRLRWLNQFNNELLNFRNQWAHSQLRGLSPEITPWLVRMADAAVTLRNIQEIPSGTGRVAVFGGAQIIVQEALATLSNASMLADQTRKVSSDISKLISQEVKYLLENTQVDIHSDPASVVVGTPNEVVLIIKNSASVLLRNIQVGTTPNIGMGKTSYLMEDAEFAVPLIVEPQQTSGTYDFLVTWTAQRLDGISVYGETSLSLAIRSLRESSVTNLGASPYIVGKPIEREEMFYGRDDVIEQIKNHLNDETQSNVILLEGNRRTGKTSILKQLQKRNNLPSWLTVECSLQGADSMATHHVFRLFARRIWEACTRAGISTWLPSQPAPAPGKPLKLELVKALNTTFSEAYPFESFELYLQSVLEAIQPCKLLLMLDEFDKLQEGIDQGITNPQVPENIRYLLHTYSDMSAIITGSRRLKRLREEYWSALFGFGYQIGISALPLDDARKLVTEPVKGRLLFLPEARDRLVNLCACQPFLIQSLCTRVFEQSKRQTERTVTPALVESAVTRMVEDNEHFRTLWSYAGTERRRMILAICQRFVDGYDPINLDFLETKFEEFGIRVPKKRGLGEDLDFLRELELIDFDSTQGHGAYGLSIPLMKKWIKCHIDIEDQKREAIREAEEVL
jgi:type I restriction enzyme M protein